MTRPLDVDTDQLRSVGASFVDVAEQIIALRADAPLADAAAAMPALRTASACNAVVTTVVGEMTTIADAARAYGAGLRSTADEYESTDEASAENVNGVEMPTPGPR